jgi:hypothetical protein
MCGVPGESLPCDGQYHYHGNVCFAHRVDGDCDPAARAFQSRFTTVIARACVLALRSGVR